MAASMETCRLSRNFPVIRRGKVVDATHVAVFAVRAQVWFEPKVDPSVTFDAMRAFFDGFGTMLET